MHTQNLNKSFYFTGGVILLLTLSSLLVQGQGIGLRELTGFGQTVDLKELTGLLDLPQSKLETHLQKRGFKRDYYASREEGPSYIRVDKKEKNSLQAFQIVPKQNDFELRYQTNSPDEIQQLKADLIRAGFTCPRERAENSTILYQRWSTRIESSVKTIDSTTIYELKATKKTLPRMKDIVAAEDLLQLDAHQYLEAVFGRENVKTDLFYFTETETNKCSVIFPNTDREAVFVWNDEENLKDIAFVLIGGNLKPGEKLDNVNAVAPNSWHSRQGLFCGMNLGELQMLNKQPVKFYNWQTESAGYLTPGNKGAIDFSNLGIIFNCLNCGFSKIPREAVIDSGNAIEGNLKVFINSLIILPEKRQR